MMQNNYDRAAVRVKRRNVFDFLYIAVVSLPNYSSFFDDAKQIWQLLYGQNVATSLTSSTLPL